MKQLTIWSKQGMISAAALVLLIVAGCSKPEPAKPRTPPPPAPSLQEQSSMASKVSNALKAEPTLNGTSIEVVAVGDSQLAALALRGTVATNAMAQKAEQAAKKQAPGYEIRNELKLSG